MNGIGPEVIYSFALSRHGKQLPYLSPCVLHIVDTVY